MMVAVHIIQILYVLVLSWYHRYQLMKTEEDLSPDKEDPTTIRETRVTK
jgi:hypothetical protein